MNFKKFRNIGDSEPRAWNAAVGTKFSAADEEDDELAAPYCDEFDDDEESDIDSDDEIIDETETETETDSTGTLKRRKLGLIPTCVVLQEEEDFMDE